MTKTTNQETKSAPMELPPGWEWQYRDKRVPAFRAEKPWTNLRTLTLKSEQDVIVAAYEIEKANQEGLAGLAGKGFVKGVEEPSSTAIKAYVEQSELDEMDRVNACQRIHEGKPVEFYDYEGVRIVITETASSGSEGVISAEGWRIVPEKDAEGVTTPEQDEFETQSYIGTRVNVGGKSRPNWWVIVGPGYEFERKSEEDDEGFQPGFPPGFDPQRAEKGLAQEDEPSLEKALHRALHSVQGAAERWLPLQQIGAADTVLTKAIADEWGLGGGSTDHGEYKYKGGKSPQFTWFDDGPLHKAQKLNGKRLLAKVREVLEIGAPGQVTIADDELAQTEVEPDRERLHKEAVARWRRERPASADAPDVKSYHPQMLQMIPVDQIEPSPTNPRKHFDPVKLRELADSIIEHGLIEPILVRPLRRTKTGALIGGDIGDTLNAWPGLADNLYYELVAGERRWRATQLAGLTQIEAKVRDLDDKAVLEIQFIENLQRSDLSAIEEAEGYKRLLDEHGYTADSLAGKLGKSKSYVYGRLKLCVLPPAALDAMTKGDLPATVGELIGRLPSMEMRQEFWDDQFEDYGKDWFTMPSFRDIKSEIESSYMRELKKAPFSRNIAQLVPGVSACIHCPKMTGNNRAEYPDARADMCTDTSCYDQKVKAHNEREMKKTVKKLEKANAEGIKVLTTEESESWFRYGSLANVPLTRDYIDLSEECDEAADAEDYEKPTPTYADLLGDSVKVEVVGQDKNGDIHQLVSRKEAEALLKEKGIKLWQPRTDTDRKETLKKQQDEKKLRQAAAIEIVERALNDVDDELFNHVKFLRLVAKLLIDHGHADVARPIAKRRGAEINAADVRGSVEKIVDGLDDADVPGFVVEWLLHGEMESWAVWGNMSDKFPLCGYFGLKPKAVMKEVSAKLKADAKEAAKAKANAKPKAKAVATA